MTTTGLILALIATAEAVAVILLWRRDWIEHKKLMGALGRYGGLCVVCGEVLGEWAGELISSPPSAQDGSYCPECWKRREGGEGRSGIRPAE